MPVDEACEIVTAIADALDYAHERGLLHRDVKPANILLSHPDRAGQRQIYLADFGIARPLTDGPGLTATNTTLGTFAYSAPEQLMGAALDGRADQYALAATAYELLAATPPFTAPSNPIAVISQHLNAIAPPLSTHRPDLAALDDAFARALEKNPAQRYRSCTDFAAALRERSYLTAQASPHAQTQAAGAEMIDRTMIDDPRYAHLFDSPGGRLLREMVKNPPAPEPATPPAPFSRNRTWVTAGIAVAAVLGVITVLALLTSRKDSEAPAPVAPSPAAAPMIPTSAAEGSANPPTNAASTIKPLSVRPVVSAFVTTPDLCPPQAPTPPDQTVRICDFTKTAVYELNPEALQIQLTNVASFLNPLTGAETVQMAMNSESSTQFQQFTAGQVGKQIAFVRDGMVVWGPKISGPIDGQVLQLSGDLTPTQAQEIVRLLRDAR